jgi:type II secretory pathway component PulK
VSGAALDVGAARVQWQVQSDLAAGIELGAATVLRLDQDMRAAEASIDLSGRRIGVRVTNERARIDLNAASAPVLTQLLESHGVFEDEAEALAANVIAWRGDGAQSSAQPWLAGNAPGDADPARSKATRHVLHPWQLASVPGFSKRLVVTLLPVVTVANGLNQIDPFLAAERVLHAMPEVTDSDVTGFLEAREGNTSREAALKILGVKKELLTAEPSAAWRIEMSAQAGSGRIRRSEAVIAILAGDSQPYRVLYVLDDQEQLSAPERDHF